MRLKLFLRENTYLKGDVWSGEDGWAVNLGLVEYTVSFAQYSNVRIDAVQDVNGLIRI